MLWFNFHFFKMGFSKGIDSHVSLDCFFSICAIAPLIISSDLKFRQIFRKFLISALHWSIPFLKYNCKYSCYSISCQCYVTYCQSYKPHVAKQQFEFKIKRLKLIQYFTGIFRCGNASWSIISTRNSNSNNKSKNVTVDL